jgi:hypothetical protein
MSGPKDNTAAAEIPEAHSRNGSIVAKVTVPFPSQDPLDEMDESLARLRALYCSLLADSQGLTDFSSDDACALLNDALNQLDPIRAFLAENEFDDNLRMPFLECRRAWFARKGFAK